MHDWLACLILPYYVVAPHDWIAGLIAADFNNLETLFDIIADSC